MKRGINEVTLCGNLVRDPELRRSNSGTAYCFFTVAQGYGKKVGDQWEDACNFIPFTAFGNLAKRIGNNLTKGSEVVVKGELKYDSRDKDGAKAYELKAIAREVIFCGSKKDAQSYSSSSGGSEFPDGEDESDADIPF